MNFEEDIKNAMFGSLVKFFNGDSWFSIKYEDRVKLEQSVLRQAYQNVDMSKVLEIVKDKIEEKIADNIINSMATEIGTDVKQIMCNKELREDLRGILREKMRALSSKVLT